MCPNAIAVLSIASAALIAVSQYLKYDQSIGGHRIFGNRFARISASCDSLLAKIDDGLIKTDDIVVKFDLLTEEYSQACESAADLTPSRKNYETARQGIDDGEESYTKKDMGD